MACQAAWNGLFTQCMYQVLKAGGTGDCPTEHKDGFPQIQGYTLGSFSAGLLVSPEGKVNRKADMALRSSPSPILAQDTAA